LRDFCNRPLASGVTSISELHTDYPPVRRDNRTPGGVLTWYASLLLPPHQAQSPNFKVEDVHDDISSAIEEDKVSSNQHMRAIGRRRR